MNLSILFMLFGMTVGHNTPNGIARYISTVSSICYSQYLDPNYNNKSISLNYESCSKLNYVGWEEE